MYKSAESFRDTEKMPVLFIGHGSPMNAIEENEFVVEWRNLGKELPKPQAVLCISAHWETRGTWVTAMKKPVTIHDFGGFPKELNRVQYPAPGSPELACLTKNLVKKTEVSFDDKWGLDHGCWSVVRRLYPHASGLELGAQVGGRYYFTDKFGLNMELGGSNSFSGGKFGISVRL